MGLCAKKIKRIDSFSLSQLIICSDEKFGADRKVLITQNKLIFFFRFYLLLYSICRVLFLSNEYALVWYTHWEFAEHETLWATTIISLPFAM